MEMTSPAEMIAHEGFRPLKRIEYERLGAEGFFDEERVELLFGVVVAMAPIDPPHAESTDDVRRVLERVLGDRARVMTQRPFAASEISEPQPDVFVVPTGVYRKEHPTRAHLIVEVAQSSLSRDRGPKATLYGMSEVDEYWIVNLPKNVVEVYRGPHAGTWREKLTFRPGGVIAMAAFPDVEIAVSDLLPPLEA